MKKLICFVMVLMMTVSVFAICANADENEFFAATDYASVAENGLIYNVNFKGTSDFWAPKGAWGGMKATVSEDGKSVALTPSSSTDGKTNLWGEMLPYPAFRMLQSSYTAVFTLTAADAEQEMGFFFDWKSGFAITPGKNSYRYVDARTNNQGKTVYEATYEGTGELSQTYAIEIKDEGTDVDGEKANFQYNITEYNLYVAKDGAWVQLFSLKNADAATAAAIKGSTNWDYDNYEFVLRFLRDGINGQSGDMTVGDMSIYKGLAVANNAVAAPGAPVTPDEPAESEPTETEPEATEPEATEPEATEPEATETANDTDNTQNTTDNSTVTTGEAEEGCASFVGLGGVALIATAAAGAFFVARSKKED